MVPVPKTVSRHALDRYQIHFPHADVPAVRLAVATSLPVDRALAYSLVGRPIPTDHHQDDARHLLHPEGLGIFVLSPVPAEPGAWFVRTYLRLYGKEQQRMARSWYLQPAAVLREAFEMGFRAARAAGAPPLASLASEEHLAELLALGPRLSGQLATTPPATATATATAPPPAPAPTPAPPAAPAPAPPAPAPPAEEVRLEVPWATSHAPGVPRVLQWYRSSHVAFEADLGKWRRSSGPATARLLKGAELSPTGFQVWIEPGAKAAALVTPGDGCLRSLLTIPRALRPELLAEAEPPPGPDDGGDHVDRPVDPPGGEAERLSGPSLRSARGWAVTGWTERALREARILGVEPIPQQWLEQLEPVEPEDLPALAERSDWRLAGAATFAARRSRTYALLLRGSSPDGPAMVARCAALTDPGA